MEEIKKEVENVDKSDEKLPLSDVINHGCSDCGGQFEYDVMDYWQCSICGKPQ